MKRYTSILIVALILSVNAFAQDTTELKQGEEVSQSLAKGGAHIYSIDLNSDFMIFGKVDQKTVDVIVKITGPDGKLVDQFDGPARGPESFRFTTKQNGVYSIKVVPFEENEGDYSILVQIVEPVADTPEGKIDQMMVEYSGEVPGAAVMVMQDDEVVLQRSFGMANLAYDVEMNEQTVHNIGSTSKQFLTFGLLLLQEQGKLSLDDDVRNHIPELPEFDHTVTLRHLVNHTSGYREYLNLLAMTGQNMSQEVSQEKVIELVQNQPKLQNVPGAEFNYNNTGYSLMTEVIERVTETEFPEWMKNNVFEPIGMNHTVVRNSPHQVVENRSMGYTFSEDGGYREVTDLGGAAGAGGIHSTMADLKKWIDNLLDPKVGTEDMIEEMTTSFKLNNGSESGYGLGLFIDKYKGLTRIHHGGADMAHRSMIMVFPEINAAVVTQSNFSNFDGSIPNKVADIYFSEYLDEGEATKESEDKEVSEFEYDPANFEPLTGRYELSVMPGFVLSFYRDEDRIYTQATNQPEVNLTATSDSTFRLVGVNASVTFHRNEDGTADSLTLHQNGNHIAKKIEFELSQKDMDQYVGRYFSEEIDTIYDVVLADSSLSLTTYLIEDKMPLNPTTEDKFSAGFPISEVDFIRDDAGNIIGFEASNGRTRGVFFERWRD
ncbi:MAG: serine hydrolase [Gracilimonas sp.]|nr:serine hydrolase [Gracilimonas sp.]